MKASELRGRSPEDLRGELARLRRQLFELKFQWQSGDNPDSSQKAKLRRDIARVLTILRETEPSSRPSGRR